MPYNILIFVSRKPGLSHLAFKNHYETSHIPLLQFFAGNLFPKRHTRHYLQFGAEDQPTVLRGDKASFDYDAVADVSFDDEAAYHAFINVLNNEEALDKLVADEDKFSDREKMKIVVIGDVQETKT
jgi:hypothetical protein